MFSMRRVAAAIAACALVGSMASPALAAFHCASASASSPSHACCAKGGEDKGTALESSPCCKVAVAVKPADQVAPQASSSSAIGAAASAPVLSEPAVAMVKARVPACIQRPATPPLGPPVRLRI
jgi:hypothetical protein